MTSPQEPSDPSIPAHLLDRARVRRARLEGAPQAPSEDVRPDDPPPKHSAYQGEAQRSWEFFSRGQKAAAAESVMDVERQLKAGLVGEHRELFATSASFQQQIELLVRMLPVWVDGLAERAAESDEYQKQAVEALRRLPTVDVSELRASLRLPE